MEVENLRVRNVEFEQLRVDLETTRKKLELADQEQIESVVLMLIREVEFAEQCAKLDGQSECARQELALAQAAAAEATILADKARQETAQLVSDSLAGNKAPVVPGSLLAQFAMKGRKAELEKEAKRAKDSLHASTKRLTDALGDFKKSREPCSKSSKGSKGSKSSKGTSPFTAHAHAHAHTRVARSHVILLRRCEGRGRREREWVRRPGGNQSG